MWNFGQTKEKPANTRATASFPAKLVKLKVTKEEANKRYEEIVVPLARKVEQSYEHRDIRRVSKNNGDNGAHKACDKFPPLGCPFKVECLGRVLQIEKDRTMEPGKKMSLVEMMRAKAAGKVPGVTNTTSTVVVPELIGKGLGFSQEVEEIEEIVAADRAMAEIQADPINAPNVVRTQAPAPPEVVDTLPKKTRKKREPLTIEERQAVPANKQQEEEALQSLPKLEIVDGKPIRTLFLDCLPLTTPVVHAHVLIAKAAETVCGDLQVLNIKLVEFGKGGGSLAAQLSHDILQLEPGFDLALNSRTVEGREVMQTLFSLSQNIIVAL